MRHITKLRKHQHSYEMCLPKEIQRELGWSAGDHILTEMLGDKIVVVRRLDDWASDPLSLASTTADIKRIIAKMEKEPITYGKENKG